jgi:1-acyl-sn-glycerol-3-phosphate acyltransferase
MPKRHIGFQAILMNLWVYPLLALGTGMGMLLSPLLLIGWKLFTGWDWSHIMRHLVWLYGRMWLLIIAPFVKIKRVDLDRTLQTRPAVLVINHHSFFDTYFMAMLPIHQIAITLRSWPFKMIWYRYFMKLGRYIDLESNSWETISSQCAWERDNRYSILFFPEGHRSRDGKIHRFHSGAFKVATDLNIPIIPLCITGSDILLPPDTLWLHPATIELRALEPFNPADFPGEQGHIALRKAVKKAMENDIYPRTHMTE